MDVSKMIHRLKTYQNGVHGDFFLEVAELLTSLIAEKEPSAQSPAAMPGSAYYYFAYTTGNNKVKCHKITEEHPVDFAIRCSDKYTDGPYIITFALQISEEMFKKHGPREA